MVGVVQIWGLYKISHRAQNQILAGKDARKTYVFSSEVLLVTSLVFSF